MRFKLRAPARIALRGALAVAGEISAPSAPTGLVFPSNAANGPGVSVRFAFSGADLQPFAPATYTWRYFPHSDLTGYSTIFFWGPSGIFTGQGYYGIAPYPDSGDIGTTHNWEISIEGTDYFDGIATLITKGQWYTQALRVQIIDVDGFDELEVSFYFDLPDTTKKIVYTSHTHYVATFPPAAPALTIGDAPWAGSNESLDGIFRGLKTFSACLSEADAASEAASHYLDRPATAAGRAAVWYARVNPTPDDLLDRSGNGHDPVWFDSSNKATLWTG